MSDDAEFDAFLKGDDALSRRFQAMPQAGPSAALDAAILQRARDLMAQEARPEAANDAGIATPVPRIAGRLGWRWRVPGAIAATVLAGVFAHQAFQASADMERNTGMPAEETVVLPPAPAPVADAAPAPAPAPAAPVMEVMPEKRSAQPGVLADVPARAPLPAPVMLPPSKPVAMAPAAPAPPPAAAAPPVAAAAPATDDFVAGYSRQAPPAPAPAPEARAAAASESMQRVEVTGSSYKRRDAESALGIAVQNREEMDAKSKKVVVTGSRIRSLASEMTPGEWFAVIEDMLEKDKDGGKDKEKAVLAEWRKFRKMYPDYPVPETFEEQIRALEK